MGDWMRKIWQFLTVERGIREFKRNSAPELENTLTRVRKRGEQLRAMTAAELTIRDAVKNGPDDSASDNGE